MGRGRTPESRQKFELPNVAGLEVLIDEIEDVDLPLTSGRGDTKVHKLRRQIERVTGNEKDKGRLKELFDVRLCDVLLHMIGALPSEKELYKSGTPGMLIMDLKKAAQGVLLGVPNLPLFDEDNRELLAMYVRKSLVEKQLIGPSRNPER